MATLSCAALPCAASHAAAETPARVEQLVDGSFGVGRTVVPQLAYQVHLQLFGEKNRLYIGPGVRLFGTVGRNWRVASENAPNDNFLGGDPNVDAIFPEDIFIGSLNAGLYVRFAFLERWEVGANTDIIGYSFGRRTRGEFVRGGTGEVIPLESIEPKPFSLFPVSGSYSTELFWAGYRVREDLLLRLGFVFSDYKFRIPGNEVPGARRDAYERIYPLALVGLSYTL